MKVYFVNRFYSPDSSATSQLLTDLAQGLSKNFDVSVITSRYGMNEGMAWPRSEQIDDVQVYRLRSTRLGKKHLWQKAIDLLSFHLAVCWFLLSKIEAEDVVVLKSDPPLLQLLNTYFIRLKKGRVINWIQDVYPEIAVRLEKFPGPSWLVTMVESWRNRALRRAAVNVVISSPMAEYLDSRGVKPLVIIPNWADESLISPLPQTENGLRAEWELQNKFVVMYSGNFGRVHQFEEICDAVRILAANPTIVFVFVGDGARLEEVEREVGHGQYRNVIFQPFRDRNSLNQSLGLADLHLVSLRPGMEDLVMPSKVYGILAAGRPIAYIGETGSHLAVEIARNEAGFSMGYGEGRELAERIEGLSSNNDSCIAMGTNAHSWFLSDFTLNQAAERWKNLLADVGK